MMGCGDEDEGDVQFALALVWTVTNELIAGLASAWSVHVQLNLSDLAFN